MECKLLKLIEIIVIISVDELDWNTSYSYFLLMC